MSTSTGAASPRSRQGPGSEPDGTRPGHRRLRAWSRSVPLLPAVCLLLVFFVGPILWAFYGSFTNMALTGPHAQNVDFIGLENYSRLAADPAFPLALWLTIVFVVTSAIVGQNILGMVLAVLMLKASKGVATMTRTVVVLTWILPELVAAFVMYAYFNKDGTFNQILAMVGIRGIDWLFTLPMVAIILGNTWRGTAFSMMVYQAALGGVPTDLTEAAMIDGANSRQRYFRVVLPIIRGIVGTNTMLITLQTLAVFTLIWVVTAGGPLNASTTLPVLAYQQAFKFGDIGYGTAIAAVMLLVGAAFAAIYVRTLRPGRSA